MNFAIDSNYYSKGYRVQLFPTETQKQFIIRCIELSRYLYNWAIDMEKEQLRLYNEGETEKSFLSVYDLGYKFTKLRQENDFLKEVPRASIENSLNRVEYAFKMYMKKQCNYPRYKSKKNKETYSYQTRGDRMFFEDNLLRIEGLPRNEFIKTRFHSGWNKYSDVKFYCPVIKIDKVGNYWISFNIITEVNTTYFEDNNIQKMDRIIGIDLNNKKRFVLSTGQIYYGPDISKELEKLNKLQRKCSKDIRRNLERTNPDAEQSNRSKKRRIKLNKQYKRIHNIEENFIQTTTKKIINMNPKAIVMESLSVKSMKKNHLIASAIQYSSFFRCREVMKYKCRNFNIDFIEADRTFKSSQICSNCGNEQDIGRSKKYICPVCGLRIDRDINAAINLEKFGYNKLNIPDFTNKNLIIS